MDAEAVIDWVNDLLDKKPKDASIDTHLSNLIIKLQLLAQDTDDAAERCMQRILSVLPWATEDLNRVHKQLSELQNEFMEISGKSQTADEMMKTKGPSYIDELSSLDRKKKSLRSAQHLLQEAVHWEQLSSESELIIQEAQGDMGKLVSHITQLKKAASAIDGLPGWEERNSTVSRLISRVEKLLSPTIDAALSSDDFKKVSNVVQVAKAIGPAAYSGILRRVAQSHVRELGQLLDSAILVIGKPSHAWSEEDEENVEECLHRFYPKLASIASTFLKKSAKYFTSSDLISAMVALILATFQLPSFQQLQKGLEAQPLFSTIVPIVQLSFQLAQNAYTEIAGAIRSALHHPSDESPDAHPVVVRAALALLAIRPFLPVIASFKPRLRSGTWDGIIVDSGFMKATPAGFPWSEAKAVWKAILVSEGDDDIEAPSGALPNPPALPGTLKLHEIGNILEALQAASVRVMLDFPRSVKAWKLLDPFTHIYRLFLSLEDGMLALLAATSWTLRGAMEVDKRLRSQSSFGSTEEVKVPGPAKTPGKRSDKAAEDEDWMGDSSDEESPDAQAPMTPGKLSISEDWQLNVFHGYLKAFASVSALRWVVESTESVLRTEASRVWEDIQGSSTSTMNVRFSEETQELEVNPHVSTAVSSATPEFSPVPGAIAMQIQGLLLPHADPSSALTTAVEPQGHEVRWMEQATLPTLVSGLRLQLGQLVKDDGEEVKEQPDPEDQAVTGLRQCVIKEKAPVWKEVWRQQAEKITMGHSIFGSSIIDAAGATASTIALATLQYTLEPVTAALKGYRASLVSASENGAVDGPIEAPPELAAIASHDLQQNHDPDVSPDSAAPEVDFSLDPSNEMILIGNHFMKIAQGFTPIASDAKEIFPPQFHDIYSSSQADFLRCCSTLAKDTRIIVMRLGMSEWTEVMKACGLPHTQGYSELESNASDQLADFIPHSHGPLTPGSDTSETPSTATIGRAMCTLWLGAIVRITVARYLETLTKVPSVSRSSIAQIVTDIDYLINVVKALGLSTDPLLKRFGTLLSIPSQKLSSLIEAASKVAQFKGSGVGSMDIEERELRLMIARKRSVLTTV